MLYRKKIFPVFPLLNTLKDHVGGSKTKKYKIIDGLMIKITSQRYKVFQKSIKCCSCGIEGSFLAAEKETNQFSKGYHLNLYAVGNDGKEVLMTKDHIKPKAKGGKNNHKNYQTMCSICNNKKGDR